MVKDTQPSLSLPSLSHKPFPSVAGLHTPHQFHTVLAPLGALNRLTLGLRLGLGLGLGLGEGPVFCEGEILTCSHR